MKRFEKHIFICTNERPEDHPRGSCGCKGAADLHALFKKKLKSKNLLPVVRANKSGCLDACEYGPTVVVYPDQIWYQHVAEEDIDQIVEEHIINDKPVERLMIKDSKFNRDE